MIPGQAQQFFEGAASASGDSYQIDRSLRFNSADTAYLNRTPSSAGNRKTWTWSGWVKLSKINSINNLFAAGSGIWAGGQQTALAIYSDNALWFFDYNSSYQYRKVSSAVFRDPSAWQHIVAVIDTANATAGDRVKLYVNGERITDFSISADPVQNYETFANSTVAHYVSLNTTSEGFDGYLADVHFIDGQALAASDFGEYDSDNNWNPKEYSGSYGTNGFYLKFDDNSSNAALGTDSSGNGNTWTVNNINAAAVPTTEVTAAWAGYTGAWSTSDTWSSLGVSTGIGQNGGSKGYSTTTESWANAKTFTGGEFGAGIRGSNGWALRYPSSTTITIDPGSQVYISDLVVCPDETTDIASGTSITTFPATVTGQVFWLRYTGSGYPAVGAFGTTTNPGPTTADSVIDTPTNYTASGNNGGNYCTLNPLEAGGYATLSNGNLDQTGGATDYSGKRGAFSMTTGKWYWEVTINGTSGVAPGPGIQATDVPNYESPVSTRRTYYNSGQKFDGSLSSYGSSFTTGDVIGVAFDADAGSLTFYKNGVSQGVAFSSLSDGPYSPLTVDYNGSSTSHNFGQRPFSISSVPTGFKSLCTENLPDPTIADGSTAFDTSIWSGNSTQDRKISTAFSPDLVWVKRRNASKSHIWIDKIRGDDNYLHSDTTNANQVQANLLGLVSDGYELGTVESVNLTGNTYVGWAWDGGSSTSSNSDGSITSNVRANASAGFSIVSYTGNSTVGATVGHGLNDVPGLVIIKNRTTGSLPWVIKMTGMTGGQRLQFDTGAVYTESAGAGSVWNATNPSSSVITLGDINYSNASSNNYIGYCWVPVSGYSAFGSYIAGGTSDDAFVFTGMRPRLIMIKAFSSAGDMSYASWLMVDSERDTYNVSDAGLFANLSAAEGTRGNGSGSAGTWLDILSNGFKIRYNGTEVNGVSGQTYMYAAWAEHPFKTARAR